MGEKRAVLHPVTEKHVYPNMAVLYQRDLNLPPVRAHIVEVGPIQGPPNPGFGRYRQVKLRCADGRGGISTENASADRRLAGLNAIYFTDAKHFAQCRYLRFVAWLKRRCRRRNQHECYAHLEFKAYRRWILEEKGA